jgi:hypothetical protein
MKINLAKRLTASSDMLDNLAMPTKLFVGITLKGQSKQNESLHTQHHGIAQG